MVDNVMFLTICTSFLSLFTLPCGMERLSNFFRGRLLQETLFPVEKPPFGGHAQVTRREYIDVTLLST